MAALEDEPRDASITLTRTARLSEDHWSDAAEANSAGGLQATFFAIASDYEGHPVAGVPTGRGDEWVVGLVGAYANQDGTVNLVGLWSAPGYRDVGVAESLLDAVRRWASEHGHHRLRRWVVARNEYAIAFYERTGFRATGATMPYEQDPRLEQVETVLDL